MINRSNGYCRQFSVSECSPYQLRCLQCYIILGKTGVLSYWGPCVLPGTMYCLTGDLALKLCRKPLSLQLLLLPGSVLTHPTLSLGKIIDTVEDQEDNFLIGEKEAPGKYRVQWVRQFGNTRGTAKW